MQMANSLGRILCWKVADPPSQSPGPEAGTLYYVYYS